MPPTTPTANAPKPAAPKPAAPVNPAKTKAPETKTPETKPADGIDLDFIGGVVMLAPALASESAPVRARSEKQTKMDEVVEKLHKAWKAGGTPSQWGKLVEAHLVATYFVNPKAAAELKRLINRAVAFHGVRARWGTPFLATEQLVTKHGLPKEFVGREVVSFAVMDKRPRTTTETASK